MAPQKSIAKSYNKIAKEYVQQHGYGEHLAEFSLKKFISFLPKRARVLDVGCGGGQDSKYLLDRGYIVHGIDVSKEMIKLAKKHSPGAVFKVEDVMKKPAKIQYHGMWCCRVFHHISLKEQGAFLHKLASLLRKDGILYITSNVSDTKKDYEAFDSGNDGLLKKRLKPKSFKALIKDQGFTILQFKYWVGKKGMEIIARK